MLHFLEVLYDTHNFVSFYIDRITNKKTAPVAGDIFLFQGPPGGFYIAVL